GTVYTTTTFRLAADVAGALPIVYQWRTNGIPIPGATSATYTKANASTADSANYDLVSTNAFGSVTSMVVSVIVNPAVPPTITLQPASRSVYAGGDATFSVAATGTTPFTYQWSFGGTNLPGQTNATLTVTSVDATKTGNYAVGVTNVAGGVVSTTAILSLYTVAPGSYAEAVVTNGPINYWHLGEPFGSTIAADAMGRLDGVYSNGVTLGVPGGLPFGTNTAVEFDGTSGRVNLNGSGVQPPWTAIFWAQRTDNPFQPSAALIDDRIAPVSCSLRLEQWDNTGLAGISQYGGFGDLTYSYSPPASGWIQIAYVGRTNGTDLYINGALTGSLTNIMPLPRRTIGASTSTDFLKAQLQEVSLYNKVLSASTLATIYAAGEYGSTTPPLIVQQPVSTTSLAGSTARFSVSAGGSLPLSYQWMKGATPIAGATTSTLSIPGAYFTDAGSYSVTITNGVGTTNSASVTLTVMPEPSYANETNSLVLHLKFDGNFNDSSGRTNNAVAVNAPVFVPGKIGTQAVRVNTDTTTSTFNYVEVLNTNTSAPYPDLQFTATNSFTVSYWSRYTGLPNDLPIICNAINSTYQPGWVFSDDTGKLEWTLTSVAPDAGQVVADPVPGSPTTDDGNWHHILVSFDRASGQANSYVDGNLVDARYIGVIANLDTGNGLFLGQDPTGVYGVTGTYDIDDLGIWQRALGSYEALSIYNAGQISNESFDVYGPIRVSINQVGGNVDVSWQAGTLLQSSSLNGIYTPVPGATPPFYRTAATGATKFFRVQQ
ncbi:MAG TPA: immunoglobulin domain-containing protein, partial [Verrucomicrobiae bacterium]|nr:immunoglobulin domain-containing protein [Verrucomicrobiae bacterium]